MIFVAGSAATYLAYAWRSAGPPRRFAAMFASLALFALALGREPSVVFLLLFLIPTLLLRLFVPAAGRWSFALCATSDLLLALALTARVAAGGGWEFPQSGEFGSGSGLLGAAALLRLSAIGRAEEERAAQSLWWWQGLFILWWAGGAAGPLLASGGAILALFGAREAYRGRSGAGFLVAAGLGAIVSAGSPPAIAVAVVGAAGAAFALGERAVSAWVLLALPLSATGVLAMEPGVLPLLFFFAAAGTASWAAVAFGISMSPETEAGRGLGAAALAGSVAVLLMLGGSRLAGWAVYAAAAALLVPRLLTAPKSVTGLLPPLTAPTGPPSKVLDLVGAGAWVVGALVSLRLLLAGLGTGFL